MPGDDGSPMTTEGGDAERQIDPGALARRYGYVPR